MGTARNPRRPGRGRRAPAALTLGLACAAAGAVLASGGPAAAVAQHAAAPASPDGHPAPPGGISTVAGSPGGPGPGAHVALTSPCGAAGGVGSLYVANGASVARLVPQGGRLTTVAGTGAAGPLGDAGPAASASLSQTCGITLDHHGNLVIADFGHGRIRVVAHHNGWQYQQKMTAGDIYSVAGDGVTGLAGDGGRAVKAELAGPRDVAVDAAGNLVIDDSLKIRVVAEHNGTFYGQAMTAGHIYTVAGDGTAGFAGDGGPATGAEFLNPASVAVDAAGNLVIDDQFNDRIRVVAAAAGTFYGQPMTAGYIYTVAGDGTAGFAGDGGPASAAEIYNPGSTVVDAAGNLVIADEYNQRIRVLAAVTGTFYGQAMTAGDIYTVAGDGTAGFAGDHGPATGAELFYAPGVAVDAAGNLVIADDDNLRVRVVAAHTARFYGKPMTAGDIYSIAGNGTGFSGQGGLATSAQLLAPGGVAADAAGNLLVADTGNNRVRAVAASSGTFYGKPMTAGHIYNIAGSGGRGYAGNGGPAADARLNRPAEVVPDAAGNLVIADTDNNRIRLVAAGDGTFYGKVMTAGHIYTIAGSGRQGFAGNGGPALAASLNLPGGVATDPAGNVVIADSANNRIRVVAASTATFYGQAMTAGHIYTVAGKREGGFAGDGGPATGARLAGPQSVAVDAAGNLLIADTNNHMIRVVAAASGSYYGQAMTAGDIYLVAGGGDVTGSGIPATSAELGLVDGISADAAGNLLIPGTGSNLVQVVAAASGTYYGQAMTAGDVYTVAGTGTAAFSGDGGPGTAAEVDAPAAVAVGAAGGLFIADTGNNRIREVVGS